MRQKPFALWVIFGGLVYFGLAFTVLLVPFIATSPGAAIADPFVWIILVFVVLFFASGILALKGKRWTFVLAAVVSILFLALFGVFLVPSLANPADAVFSLAITGIPALILVAVFSILSLTYGRGGLQQRRYLATPNSGGGLFTIGVIGFVIGGLIIGTIAAGVILGNIRPADITIVSGAPSAAVPFSPRTFTASVGDTVVWVNADRTSHTVTSNGTGPLNSVLLSTGATFSYTFTQPGTYYYHCEPHPQMWGVVIVS